MATEGDELPVASPDAGSNPQDLPREHDPDLVLPPRPRAGGEDGGDGSPEHRDPRREGDEEVVGGGEGEGRGGGGGREDEGSCEEDAAGREEQDGGARQRGGR